MTKRITAYDRLRSIAGTVHADCAECTTRQLRAMLKKLDALSTTNCGWDVYAMRAGVREIVRTHLYHRSRKARRAKAPKRAPTPTRAPERTPDA